MNEIDLIIDKYDQSEKNGHLCWTLIIGSKHD